MPEDKWSMYYMCVCKTPKVFNFIQEKLNMLENKIIILDFIVVFEWFFPREICGNAVFYWPAMNGYGETAIEVYVPSHY